jgi:lipopolysaccharide/colanic/teichoic acid biosynthesis glycosyltransferase
LILKFRTLKEERPGIMVRDGCPDLTRTGGFLRRTGLDELPQALNVLRGEMSLVGPRPMPLPHPTLRDPRYLGRLAGKPGITGPAQLAGRSRVPWPERLALDLAYLDAVGPLADLALLARTAAALVARRI